MGNFWYSMATPCHTPMSRKVKRVEGGDDVGGRWRRRVNSQAVFYEGGHRKCVLGD
jgi:hypothetical protein